MRYHFFVRNKNKTRIIITKSYSRYHRMRERSRVQKIREMSSAMKMRCNSVTIITLLNWNKCLIETFTMFSYLLDSRSFSVPFGWTECVRNFSLNWQLCDWRCSRIYISANVMRLNWWFIQCQVNSWTTKCVSFLLNCHERKRDLFFFSILFLWSDIFVSVQITSSKIKII